MSEIVSITPVSSPDSDDDFLVDKGSRHNKHATKRSLYFVFLLYPDDPEHMEVYDWIVEHEDYVSVLHNKDLREHIDEPELGLVDDTKKAHYHVIVRFPNARTIGGVQKYFNNQVDRFVKVCNDPYSFAQYMIHNTFESQKKKKFRYSLDDVTGNPKLKARLFSDFKATYEENIVSSLIKIIEGRTCTSLRSLLKYLIMSNQPDLLCYVVSHSYLVQKLLLSDNPAYGAHVFEPEHRNDSKPLSHQEFHKAVDRLVHDFNYTDSPDLVPSNRSQRRRVSKKKR